MVNVIVIIEPKSVKQPINRASRDLFLASSSLKGLWINEVNREVYGEVYYKNNNVIMEGKERKEIYIFLGQYYIIYYISNLTVIYRVVPVVMICGSIKLIDLWRNL